MKSSPTTLSGTFILTVFELVIRCLCGFQTGLQDNQWVVLYSEEATIPPPRDFKRIVLPGTTTPLPDVDGNVYIDRTR
jgi:hypothetical protein